MGELKPYDPFNQYRMARLYHEVFCFNNDFAEDDKTVNRYMLSLL